MARPQSPAVPRVSRAMQTLRFEEECADAGSHEARAYAELGSEDGRARALVLVYARRDAARQGDLLAGVRLVAMRLEAGIASAKWSVGLEARTAVGHHVGTGHSHYISCPARGEARRQPFRADGNGVLDWLDCVEPVERMGSGGYPRNLSPTMEATAGALGLTDESRTVALDLVLTETGGGRTVRLCGPGILIPDRIWYARPSKSRAPDLLASLNPFVRGGLWRTLARAARTRGCVRERRRAKRAFATR